MPKLKLSNLIQSIDSVGVRPEISYKGQTRHKTLMGRILSITLYLSLLAGLIYFGSEIYNRDNPSIITGNIYNSEPPRMNLSPQNFPIAIGVQDPTNYYNYFKDPSIYTLNGVFSHQIRSIDEKGNIISNTIEKNVKLSDCNIETHFPGLEKEFSNYDYKNTYCIDPSESIFLIGDFDNDDLAYFRINMAQCNNATSTIPCKTQEEIDQKLKKGYIDIQHHYYFYSPKNFTEPMSRNRKSYYTTISNYEQSEIEVYLKKISYITDSGIMTKDTDMQSYTQLDTIRQLVTSAPSEKGETFSFFTFRLSLVEEVNERSYIKIQTLLASLGGLSNINYNDDTAICLWELLLFRYY